MRAGASRGTLDLYLWHLLLLQTHTITAGSQEFLKLGRLGMVSVLGHTAVCGGPSGAGSDVVSELRGVLEGDEFYGEGR